MISDYIRKAFCGPAFTLDFELVLGHKKFGTSKQRLASKTLFVEQNKNLV